MAFGFETRWPDRIFFPTVHIHDGAVHAMEEFDHTLYLQYPDLDQLVGEYQNRQIADRATGLVRSRWAANQFCKTELTGEIVVPDLLVHRMEMRGMLRNQDVIHSVSATIDSLQSRPSSVGRYWPALPALLGLAGMGWLFNRRSKLMSP